MTYPCFATLNSAFDPERDRRGHHRDRDTADTHARNWRTIFRRYADGSSPEQIAKRLNREKIRGPAGGPWSPSTINGNWQRGTGILNNELYIGRIVWNRMRYVRDPDTGKRVSRANPESEWITSEAPHLRIVPDDLWEAVKRRQKQIRASAQSRSQRQTNRQRRPRYLFSGLTRCGVCGGGFHVYSHDYLGCFSARDRGTCGNRLTIRREEVEHRVLAALQHKLLQKELFAEFCAEFTREMNRLRTEARASISLKQTELGRVEREIGKLIQALKDGSRPHRFENRSTS